MQHGLISAKTKLSESNNNKINVIFTSTSVLLKKKHHGPLLCSIERLPPLLNGQFILYLQTTPHPSLTSFWSFW